MLPAWLCLLCVWPLDEIERGPGRTGSPKNPQGPAVIESPGFPVSGGSTWPSAKSFSGLGKLRLFDWRGEDWEELGVRSEEWLKSRAQGCSLCLSA